MLLSMTGFGKATAESENKKITAEIKSLNSKQMDLTVRLPHIFRESEADIRADITRALIRGKADIVVNVESAQGSADVSLNVAALAQYKDLISKASATLGIPEPADWYSVLLRFPDIMHADAADTVTDEETAALRRAVADAVEQLTAHRRAEGRALRDAERGGRCPRVVQHALHHRAGHGQRRADEYRSHSPREADAEEHRVRRSAAPARKG